MEQVNNLVALNPENEMILELNRVAQIMSDSRHYISINAYLASAQAGAGVTSILRTPTTKNDEAWITCYLGGLALGAAVDFGKLTIDNRINQEGYRGSCSAVIIHCVVGYTNIIGYDEHSNPVLWFNGGGAGLDIFIGGGIFNVNKKIQ
ncbi:hypothetical protein ACQPT2_21050 [Erwinia amylovora]